MTVKKRMDFQDRFIVETNYVTDKEWNLIWQREISKNEMTWQQALYYAFQKSQAGDTQWRLPTIEELLSLFHEKEHGEIIKPDWIKNDSNWYWSSSPLVGSQDRSWVVSFFSGNVGYYNHDLTNHVRLVRSF